MNVKVRRKPSMRAYDPGRQAGEQLMSTTHVERLTEAEARARRNEILDSVGGDESAFHERAHDYLLDSRELALHDELNALDYLLGS